MRILHDHLAHRLLLQRTMVNAGIFTLGKIFLSLKTGIYVKNALHEYDLLQLRRKLSLVFVAMRHKLNPAMLLHRRPSWAFPP
ncbi:MAG: hypothetical protein AAGE13_15395 [Pseudomonadota bacterium]